MIVKGLEHSAGIRKGRLHITVQWIPEPNDLAKHKINQVVYIPENVNSSHLESWLQGFNRNIVATLNSIWDGYQHKTLKAPVSDYISPLMRHRNICSLDKVKSLDVSDLLASTNEKLKVISFSLGVDNTIKHIYHESITIGPGAVVLDKSGASDSTFIDKEGPASGTGILDTVEAYWTQCPYPEIAYFYVGTFYEVDTNIFTCRDYEGPIAFESILSPELVIYTGLDIEVSEGDLLGHYHYHADTDLYYTTASGAGWYRYVGSRKVPCENTTFEFFSTRKFAIYATGASASVGAKNLMLTNVG